VLTAFAILLALTAAFAFLNERFVRLPTTIGVTVSALLASLTLLLLEAFGLGARDWAEGVLNRLNFSELVLQGLLSFLLFAGALGVDARALLRERTSVIALALLGTLASTALIGGLTYLLLNALGLHVPFAYALIFGALISPTDPVAVLNLLKRAKVPKRLETLIAGESLFNDGVGVVVFATLLGLIGAGAHGAGHGGEVSVASALMLFLQEAGGGLLLGAALGGVGFLLLRSINEHGVEVLITLALVVGGYALATGLHVSGPLAMVIAGLVIGATRDVTMSEHTRVHMDSFWETTDQVLNMLLFALIGLEILIVTVSPTLALAAFLIIPIVLGARLVSVALPLTLVRPFARYGPFTVRLLTWGGLRGGIAVALALSLPAGGPRDTLLVLTYGVVLFSIIVQGLTVMPIVHNAARNAEVRRA